MKNWDKHLQFKKCIYSHMGQNRVWGKPWNFKPPQENFIKKSMERAWKNLSDGITPDP